uniref:Uncharacterized protein n=1 Tax=Triticum urartu TaxID=4572 RepID=A0A8R7QPK7_TRIUA
LSHSHRKCFLLLARCRARTASSLPRSLRSTRTLASISLTQCRPLLPGAGRLGSSALRPFGEMPTRVSFLGPQRLPSRTQVGSFNRLRKRSGAYVYMPEGRATLQGPWISWQRESLDMETEFTTSP